MKDIYIVGAGTYGEVMYELAVECGYNVVGFLDDNKDTHGAEIMGVKVLGSFTDFDNFEGNNFIVAVGNNKVRHDLMTMINNKGGETPSIIHPSVYVSKSAVIGKGVYIQMGAVIWTKVIIEDFVIISPNTVIAHHSTVGHSSLISILCTVGASVTVGEYTMFGIGSNVITGVKKVGRNVVVGGGATVVKDVEDNSLVVGCPAKKIKDREPIIEN